MTLLEKIQFGLLMTATFIGGIIGLLALALVPAIPIIAVAWAISKLFFNH